MPDRSEYGTPEHPVADDRRAAGRLPRRVWKPVGANTESGPACRTRRRLRERPHRSLTDILHDAGYQSATFGKQHHALSDRCFEHAEGFGVRHQATHFFHYFEPYDGADYDMVQYPGIFPWVLAGRYPEGQQTKVEYQIADRIIAWLGERDPDRPFLLRASFPGPHTPVTPPPPYDSAIDPAEIVIPPETESRPEGLPRWLSRDWAITNGADILTADQVSLMRRHSDCHPGQLPFLLVDPDRARGLRRARVRAAVSGSSL